MQRRSTERASWSCRCLYLGAVSLRTTRGIEGDTRDIERDDVAAVWQRHDAESARKRLQLAPVNFGFPGDVPFCPVSFWNEVPHNIGKINIRTVVYVLDVAHHAL